MSKVLKIILVIILILMLAAGVFFGWQYFLYKKDPDPDKTFLAPRLEFANVEINSFTAEKTEATLKLLVKNQLPLNFTVDSLDYSLFIKDTEVLEDQYKKTIKLIKDDSTWIYLPVILKNKDLEKILKSSESKGHDSINYTLKTTFYTKILDKRKFELEISKKLPLLYIPEIELNKFRIDSINFKRAIIMLDVAIANKNVFPIELKNINYKVGIEGNEWILGKLDGITKIKKQGITTIQIPVRLSLKEVGNTLGDLIRNGKNVNYKLNLKFNIVSEDKKVKNAQVVIESDGSIQSVIDAME